MLGFIGRIVMYFFVLVLTFGFIIELITGALDIGNSFFYSTLYKKEITNIFKS